MTIPATRPMITEAPTSMATKVAMLTPNTWFCFELEEVAPVGGETMVPSRVLSIVLTAPFTLMDSRMEISIYG